MHKPRYGCLRCRPALHLRPPPAAAQIVVEMASRGLRCICLAYTDYAVTDGSRPADFFEDADRVDANLVALAVVGIKDPVR